MSYLEDPVGILVYLITLIGFIYYLNSKSKFSIYIAPDIRQIFQFKKVLISLIITENCF